MLFCPTLVKQITGTAKSQVHEGPRGTANLIHASFVQFCARSQQSLQAWPFHEPQQPVDLHEHALVRHVPGDLACAVDKRKYVRKTNGAADKRKRSTGTVQAEDQASRRNDKDSLRMSSDRCRRRGSRATDNVAATSGSDTRQLNSTN